MTIPFPNHPLGVNKNRKLVAFAERGDRPHVVVFDLELRKRRKVLRCAEFVSQEVISLAFSHDSKYLLAPRAINGKWDKII